MSDLFSFIRRTLLCTLTAALASMVLLASAQAADDNMTGLTTPNGKLAYDFINLWFNEGKTGEAFDKYVSRDHYMNHEAPANRHLSFEEEKVEEARSVPPGCRFVFKQLISQGNLVFAHINAFKGAVKADDSGDEMVIVLRVKDGKIVDQWDVHTPVKPDSAVFVGLDR